MLVVVVVTFIAFPTSFGRNKLASVIAGMRRANHSLYFAEYFSKGVGFWEEPPASIGEYFVGGIFGFGVMMRLCRRGLETF